MSTPVIPLSANRPDNYPVHPLPPGPIIVATDGSASSEPAFAAAMALVEQTGLTAEVLSVVEPSPRLRSYEPGAEPLPDSVDGIRLDLQKTEIERQLASQPAVCSKWPVQVRLGDPPATIARIAEEQRAALVITGMNRHGLIDRLLGNETPLNVAQLGPTPLLAVTNFKRLPSTALIALDLDSPGVNRFRESLPARALFAQLRTLYVVHVVPPAETWGPNGEYWDRAYGEAVNNAFARIRRSLDLPTSVRIEMISPNGDPAREILDFSAFAKVDLIVAGRRNAHVLRRRVAGGLIAKLLRGAPCSVLLLPEPLAHPAVDRALRVSNRTEVSTHPEGWALRLRDFGDRNLGRRANMEIDDRAMGSQIQVKGYPLLGIDYDASDDHVDIMLGQLKGTRHLTHRVPLPTEIDIQVAPDGTDHALRVTYHEGHVLLTFTS
jgi:nucleotide-binding universal stress UspA family protein